MSFFQAGHELMGHLFAGLTAPAQRRLAFPPVGVVRCLCADGDMLETVTAALTHRQDDGAAGGPVLELLVVPRSKATRRIERLRPGPGSGTADGGTRWFEESDLRVSLYHEGFSLLYVLDRRGMRGALFLFSDELPYPVLTSPFLPLLHWFFASRGIQVAHAAAVSVGGRSLLVAGRGGAGKSTAALAALSDGFGFIGDDMVLVHPAPGKDGTGFLVSSLFRSAKLNAGEEDRFPRLRWQVVLEGARRAGGASPKSVMMIRQPRERSAIEPVPVHAAVVPTRVLPRAIPSGARLRASQAFLHLAPNALLQLPGDRAGSVGRFRAIASQVPFHALDLGTPAETAGRLREFLDRCP